MRGVLIAIAGLAVVALLERADAQDKKEGDEPLVVQQEELQIRAGGAADNDDEAAKKAKAVSAKYHGKTVKLTGMLSRTLVDEKMPLRRTLRLTFPVTRNGQAVSAEVQADFVLPKEAAELNQPSKSGLIVTVVGRAKVDDKGRITIENARVVSTNIPPG